VALTEVDFAIYSEILGGSINISRTLVNNKTVNPIFSKGLMRIPLSRSLDPGQSVIFHVEFSVTVPTLGGDFYYGIFGYNDSILSLAQAYPTILVYNDQGWNNQSPDLDGDPLFSDISFYLVSIDAPADLMLVTSGVEVNREETTGRQRVLFADGPARDFYLAASQDFVKQSEKAGEITYNSYSPASMGQYAKSALKVAEAAIDDFSQRYAPYPYTEFDIVPIVTSAGGVEFPGMTAVAKNVFSEGSYLDVVVIHEVAHQWFYNLVGNETQQQPWLDESLAQFLTCQYFLDHYGTQAEQTCQNEMQANWNSIADRKIPIGKPVSAYSSEEYIAIVYGRGPFFFLALRQQIGQTAFDSLMHDYTTSFAWDIATTDSFKKLAEQHCNCNLTPLFNEWVYP
jgi:aminopeptidase N